MKYPSVTPGIIPWDSPYTSPANIPLAQAIQQIAPIFSQSLAPLVANYSATRTAVPSNASNVDISSWTVNLPSSSGRAQSLFMLANLNYANVVVGVETDPDASSGKGSSSSSSSLVQTLLGQGSVGDDGKLVVGMGSTGIAAFVVEHAAATDGSGGGGGQKKSASDRSMVGSSRWGVVAVVLVLLGIGNVGI
jgi:hypothetical protein